MDVLIVEDTQTDRLVLERLVMAIGHQARVAKTGIEAKAAIGERPPDIVLLDWMLPGLHGEALAKWVRGADDGKYVYIVFVTAKQGVDAMRVAFAAGADDYMLKPVHRDELAARLRAAERIVKLESRLRDRVLELESALRRLDVSAAMKGARAANVASFPQSAPSPSDDSLPGNLRALPAWGRIDDVVRSAVDEFLMGEFEPGGAASSASDFDARITLTNVALGLEIALGIAADRGSVGALAERLFGAPEDDTMLQDLLGEVANTVMGAVKAAFVADGETFTGGVPTSGRGESRAWLAERYPWHRTVALTHEGVHLDMTVAVRERPTLLLGPKELREGMVLARDVRDANGVLLVAAGTRISATLATRMERSAPTARIHIIDPAAS